MNPDDQNYGAGAEAAHQADSIQKQMAAEAIADAPEEPPVDNFIMAGIESDEEMKPLSEVLHEGATPIPTPEVGALVQDVEPTQPVNEKQPGKKKPLIIGIIAFVLIAAGVGVWLFLANSNNPGISGAKADPERKAFFVEGDNGNTSYAIYNDKGDKLTGFDYEKVSDFNPFGYAIAKKVGKDEYGLIANTGKMSVAYGEYENIEAFGPLFVLTKDGAKTLTNGSGETIMKVEQTSANYNLYAVYDGNTTAVFDKHGEKLGESPLKNPFPTVSATNDDVCVRLGKRTSCFDTTTGDATFSIETEKDIEHRGASSNNQCATFVDQNDNYYYYYYGQTKSLGKLENGLINLEHDKYDGCFFGAPNHYIVGGGDGEFLSISELGLDPDVDTASVVIRDANHYAFVSRLSKDSKSVTINNGGVKKVVEVTGFDTPTISATKDLIAVAYEGTLYVYGDGPEPLFSVEERFIQAKAMSDINEKGNFSTYNYIVNKDKGVIYKSKYLYVSAKDGYFFSRESLPDKGEYGGVYDADGNAVIADGDYDIIKYVNGKFIARSGNSYSLIDGQGKVLLRNFDDIQVFDSHYEALKSGKIEYYTLDLKKIK